MKDPLKTIESLQNIKLSENEKAEIFSHIQHHINENLKKPISSPYTPSFNVWSFIQRHSMYATTVALVLIIAGSSAAAEIALPGDLLYPVKRNVNENIMEILAFSDQSKASIKIKLVERRFEEAEKVLAAASDNESVLVTLATDIQEHTAEALQHIEDVQTTDSDTSAVADAVELSNELSSTITAHDTYIDSITGTASDVSVEIMSMAVSEDTLTTSPDAPATKQATLETEDLPTLQSIVEEAKMQAEMTSSNISFKVSSSEISHISNDHISETKRELENALENKNLSTTTKETIESLITSAEQSMSNNNLNNAFIMLEEAEKIAETEIKKEEIGE